MGSFDSFSSFSSPPSHFFSLNPSSCPLLISKDHSVPVTVIAMVENANKEECVMADSASLCNEKDGGVWLCW